MKKIALALVIIFAFTMVLAACGTKTPAASTPPASSTPPSASAPASSTPPSASAPASSTPPSASAPASSTPPSPPASTDDFAKKPEVTLLLTNQDPDHSLPGQYCHAWAEMVFNASKGRIKVQVNNGGSIAGPTESLDKVKAGSVDIAWGLQSFYPGQFLISDGLTLPFLPYKSSAQASQVAMDIWKNHNFLQQDSGYAGTKMILIRSNCDAPIMTNKKKLETAADLSGLTIRASAAPLVTFLGQFNATGKGCPITELYQNMQNGAFDGALSDWHAVKFYQLYEAAKFYADEKVQFNTYFFLMNQSVYDKLSPENKAAIDACCGQAALDLMKDAWDNITAEAKDLAVKNGGTIYNLPPAEHQKLLDAAAVAIQTWKEKNGDNAVKLYDTILSLCK